VSGNAVSEAALDARLAIRVGEGERAFAVDAELALAAGVLVLFGPSGVGKTLTLGALAGLVRGARGHVRVRGATLLDSAAGLDVPAHERRVGYVPQQHALFPFLDVAGNVAFGLPRAERRAENKKITALLDELGLARLAKARVEELSGGERQRVALGRALAVEPRLLLLDEPFASLDREGRAALGKLVRDLIDRRGVPAVLVTHDVEEALALGDRLVRFERGKAVEAGAPGDVLGRGAVVMEGVRSGPIEPIGAGRARVRLREAIVEGPPALLEGREGEPLRIRGGVIEPAKRS
jgi:molybdate transport system ATP-binding protein